MCHSVMSREWTDADIKEFEVFREYRLHMISEALKGWDLYKETAPVKIARRALLKSRYISEKRAIRATYRYPVGWRQGLDLMDRYYRNISVLNGCDDHLHHEAESLDAVKHRALRSFVQEYESYLAVKDTWAARWNPWNWYLKFYSTQ